MLIVSLIEYYMPSSPVSLTFHTVCPSHVVVSQFFSSEPRRVAIRFNCACRDIDDASRQRVTPHGYRAVYSIKRMEARSSDSRSTGGNDKVETKKKKKFLFQRGTPYREVNTDQIYDDYGNKIETKIISFSY